MKRTLLGFVLCAAVAGPFLACKKAEPGGSTPAGKPADKRAPSAPTEAVEMKMKWPVGYRYTYRTDIDQDIQMKMPQMPNPMHQQVAMGQNYSLSVLKETPDGGREIEFEFVSMEMDVRMNERSVMNFDSKGESTGDTEAFRKLMGSKLKFLLNSSNQLEKVEGYEELMKKATSGGPPQSRQMLEQMYGEDFFKRLMDEGRGLPKEPVKVGDRWLAQQEVPMGPMGKMMLDMNCTFKGWEDRDQHKCAVLEFTGTLKQKPGENPAAMGGVSFEKGKISGKNWFDPELGAVIAGDADVTMSMNVPVPTGRGAPPGQQGMSGEMKMKVKSSLAELGKAGAGGG